MRVRLIILLLGLSLGLTMRYLFPPDDAASGGQQAKRAAPSAVGERSSSSPVERPRPGDQPDEEQHAAE